MDRFLRTEELRVIDSLQSEDVHHFQASAVLSQNEEVTMFILLRNKQEIDKVIKIMSQRGYEFLQATVGSLTKSNVEFSYTITLLFKKESKRW